MKTRKPYELSCCGEDSSTSINADIFRATVYATHIPMVITNPREVDNPIVFANAAFTGLTGYQLDEIVGVNCRFLQGPKTDRDTISKIEEALSEGSEISVELINYRKDGSMFWNALFIRPICDDSGRPLFYFSSQKDISRHRHAEDALQQALKMAVLGQLTSGIAHDFNNLLQIMLSFSELLEESIKRKLNFDKITENFIRLRNTINKASALTRQLLSFSKKGDDNKSISDLNLIAKNCVEVARQTFGKSVKIRADLSNNLNYVLLDEMQFEVALLNILLNANDALPGLADDLILVTSKNVSFDEPVLIGDKTIRRGDYVVIEVTDNGHGIDEDTLRHVLNPFFTTKGDSKGTGLGLFMVDRFVKQSGGDICIASYAGLSTTFSLYFPALICAKR